MKRKSNEKSKPKIKFSESYVPLVFCFILVLTMAQI